CATGPGLVETRRCHRVEVADGDVDTQPERQGVVDTRVRRDHHGIGPERAGKRRRGRVASDDDDAVLEIHGSLRWHYPDQVRGSVTLPPDGGTATLSARLARAPLGFGRCR